VNPIAFLLLLLSVVALTLSYGARNAQEMRHWGSLAMRDNHSAMVVRRCYNRITGDEVPVA